MKINKNINHTKKAYSIIVAIGVIGFLLVLTTGVFKLVLNEMYDNRGMGNAIKAYAGAESAQELALLQIKEEGYGYYDTIDESVNNKSIILANNPLSIANYKGGKDVLISYDIGSKTSSYTGSISYLQQEIIPLFYEDSSGIKNIDDISFSVSLGNISDIAWNIVGETSGISLTGNVSTSTNLNVKSYDLSNKTFNLTSGTIGDFLASSDKKYLILFNTSTSNNIEYNISSTKEFTKPKTKIISSAKVGGYKQNLKTTLDNTEYLNILKYSIYSN